MAPEHVDNNATAPGKRGAELCSCGSNHVKRRRKNRVAARCRSLAAKQRLVLGQTRDRARKRGNIPRCCAARDQNFARRRAGETARTHRLGTCIRKSRARVARLRRRLSPPYPHPPALCRGVSFVCRGGASAPLATVVASQQLRTSPGRDRRQVDDVAAQQPTLARFFLCALTRSVRARCCCCGGASVSVYARPAPAASGGGGGGGVVAHAFSPSHHHSRYYMTHHRKCKWCAMIFFNLTAHHHSFI